MARKLEVMAGRVIVLALVMFTLFACSEADAVSPDPSSVPQLDPFTVGFMGIDGLKPRGWVETYPGTFLSPNVSGVTSVLVERAYPQVDLDWLLRTTILTRFTPLGALPDHFSIREANGLTWRVYGTEVTLPEGVRKLDLALSETETHSFIIALLTDQQSHSEYHECLFLPVLDGLRRVPGSQREPPDAATEARFTYDSGLPLDALESGRATEGGVTEIELTFNSPRGGRVPATLMIPEGDGPFPGMIIQHGFPSNRHGIRPLALRYARRGVVTIAIDAPWARPEHSDRNYPLTFTEADAAEQVQLIIDLRRAVDLLTMREDVDPTQLVYVGVSYGGAMGGLLSGIEDRLKAYVLVLGDGGLVEHFFTLANVLFGQGEWVTAQQQRAWVEAMWLVEPATFVGRASPAALLFQNGEEDVAVPAPDAIRYQLWGSEPKTIFWYDGGHTVSPQLLDEQEDWLRQFIAFEVPNTDPHRSAAPVFPGLAERREGSLLTPYSLPFL